MLSQQPQGFWRICIKITLTIMARPKIKPNIDARKLTINPFSLNPDFIIKAHDVEMSTEVVATKDLSEGIITKAPSLIKSSYVAEREPFTKVYSTACHRKRILLCHQELCPCFFLLPMN